MKHKFLRNFVDGVWTKPTRTIIVDGEEHDLDEYAKKHKIDLPEGKKHHKKINTDIQEEKDADLGPPLFEGHTSEHGDGDSEGSE
jgi:hypothetical protein